MKSVVKLVGLSTCCIAGSITAANAEPTVLADAELENVTAGVSLLAPTDFGLRFRLGPIPPDDTFYCAAIGCRPGEPGYPISGGPVPVEPPGCETGACNPGPGQFPGLEPVTPFDFPPLERIQPITWPSPGGYCGPACDPGPGLGR